MSRQAVYSAMLTLMRRGDVVKPKRGQYAWLDHMPRKTIDEVRNRIDEERASRKAQVRAAAKLRKKNRAQEKRAIEKALRPTPEQKEALLKATIARIAEKREEKARSVLSSRSV